MSHQVHPPKCLLVETKHTLRLESYSMHTWCYVMTLWFHIFSLRRNFQQLFKGRGKQTHIIFEVLEKSTPKKKLLLLVCCNPTLGGIKHLQIQRAGFLLKWDVEKLETKFCAIRDKSNDPTKARQKQPFYPIKHRLIVSKGRNSGGSSRWIKQKKQKSWLTLMLRKLYLVDHLRTCE